MSSSFKPKGMPNLIPYLIVRDAQKAIAFYRDVCQFTLLNEPAKQDNVITHAEMALGEAVIMMAPEGTWGETKKAPITSGVSSSVYLFVYVPDVDKHFEHAKAHGAEILKAPENMFWGDRYYQLRDPDGYEWGFATHLNQGR